jgi:hypothetical protein
MPHHSFWNTATFAQVMEPLKPWYVSNTMFYWASNRETKKPDTEIIGVERIICAIPGEERNALGFMCKDIIDTGRLLWLRSKGLDADLVSYVASNISPENHLLIAKCRS